MQFKKFKNRYSIGNLFDTYTSSFAVPELYPKKNKVYILFLWFIILNRYYKFLYVLQIIRNKHYEMEFKRRCAKQ